MEGREWDPEIAGTKEKGPVVIRAWDMGRESGGGGPELKGG